MNPATTPVSVEDVQGDGRWMSLHQRFIAEAKEREPEVLFIGDSLMQNLALTELWEKLFVPMHCLNFGVGGDQTQHVLWRIQNGELENISPKVIVLLVGTNNHGHTAQQTAEGILEISRAITQKQPQGQLIVMALPPRGQKPNPLREKIATINQIVSDEIATISGAQFFNVDASLFVNADGEISPQDMHDYLHLTKRGYQKLAEPLLDEVQTLLKNFMQADVASVGDADN
ncbi:hypothetical protein CAPTEDRAFT_156453 [Capitella teleta]|uniref:SGNH hydrolase-type esterase domain-containing protein n=1 Tax=Capitella teleta TaxID=283909 RepID=R7V0N4_CAPTE|nr:hypothetical protein CAPTEDRAFT_156453 [Capitella teleta]|eukprot:ELU09241.1 hypothetical protein CAPTEDRAFT_156453 [Capitella teleta]